MISLRDVEGWPSHEVCEALEVSEGNQRVLLHRARTKVRAALESYFGHSRYALVYLASGLAGDGGEAWTPADSPGSRGARRACASRVSAST